MNKNYFIIFGDPKIDLQQLGLKFKNTTPVAVHGVFRSLTGKRQWFNICTKIARPPSVTPMNWKLLVGQHRFENWEAFTCTCLHCNALFVLFLLCTRSCSFSLNSVFIEFSNLWITIHTPTIKWLSLVICVPSAGCFNTVVHGYLNQGCIVEASCRRSHRVSATRTKGRIYFRGDFTTASTFVLRN